MTSLSNLSKTLRPEFDVTIATRNRDISSPVPYNDVPYDVPTRFGPYSVIYLSQIGAAATLAAVNESKPDVIYLNSFYSPFTRAILFLLFWRKVNAKIILAPRGEFQANALAIKRCRKILYIGFCKLLGLSRQLTFHATDRIEAERIKLFFGDASIVTLRNIPRPIQTTPREKQLHSQLQLVFVGRIRANKKLLYAINILSKCTVDVSLDVYGPIEDEKYWDECQAAITNLGRNVQVRYQGLLAHEDVPATLLEYHALLLPTETENFGHAIVEAMQSGVVPIISDQTPWRNLKESNAGWDINLQRPDLFLDAVHQLHAMDSSTYKDLSASTMRYIHERLQIDQLAGEYSRIFNEA